MKATLATAVGILLVVLGYFYGYGRAAIALLLAAGILYLGFSYFTAAGRVPPDIETEDVSEEGLRYVCRMCGLELKVETATTDRAPTHCREKMELINVGPKAPPLRPV
ncbi:MAG TPA: hypothetical protein VJ927_06625 [Actinomycetota bacterium]|nr:hypothetical protein [Actinomycetota bacterium]